MSNYGDWKSGAISDAEYNRYCRMEDDQDQAAYDEKERISKLVDDVERDFLNANRNEQYRTGISDNMLSVIFHQGYCHAKPLCEKRSPPCGRFSLEKNHEAVDHSSGI